MAEKFSLKDHLFNKETVSQLAAEYAASVPGFDAELFVADALAGFAERGLLARMDWMADCLEDQLAGDFPTMADQLEAAMPEPLDPACSDDDFGQFIHALPGILAVRHGLETHRDRALDLIHAATKRFSMEFYIRPFLERWPTETLARLDRWAGDENYHVRRLVSEGTRPKLPWARALDLSPDQTVPLLSKLHADATRYVTRSVANHLNDLAKSDPDRVIALLGEWAAARRQNPKELDWMTRHALRSLIRQGHEGALAMLGYRRDVPVTATLDLGARTYRIGDSVAISCRLSAERDLPVIVDYRLLFARPAGKTAQKVFKLRTGKITGGSPLDLRRKHRMKGDATTFTLHPGPHRVVLQVNGQDVAEADFELLPAS